MHPSPVANPGAHTQPEFDLAVVGGGFAGMIAAARAVELGLQTVLVEKGAGDRYPCNARFSGGLLHAAFHDVQRPAEELRAILDAATLGQANPAMIDTVATDGRRLLAWLRALDVRFMRFSWQEAHRWGMAPPRPVSPGLEWCGRGPDVMLRTIRDAFLRQGGQMMLATEALDLDLQDGHVRGLAVRGPDGTTRRIAVRAVALCDGGFQSDLDLLRQHVMPHPEAILQRGAANGTGAGLRMALRAGAATCNMDRFYGHLHGRRALQDPKVWPYPELDSVAAAAMVVTPDGRRFCDEGLGGMAVSNAVGRLADPASATIILDATIWEGPGRGARVPANPFLERFGGEVLRADSLRALAGMAGIDPDGLEQTVEAYNRAVAGEAILPPRSATKSRPWPVAQAPYLAIPVCVGITYTMGGMVVDGDGCVMGRDGAAIAGLYAAGTTIGGLEGFGETVGYVGGFIQSVFGLRVAEHLGRASGSTGRA